MPKKSFDVDEIEIEIYDQSWVRGMKYYASGLFKIVFKKFKNFLKKQNRSN